MGGGDMVAQLFCNHSPFAGVAAAEVTQETVESLMQKFKESFRTNTPIEIGQLQPALRSTSVGRRKRRSRPRGTWPWCLGISAFVSYKSCTTLARNSKLRMKRLSRYDTK